MGTAAELTAIVGDVAAYFQAKLPADKTIDLWALKLSGLNLRASRARIVEIITNADTVPRNFPAAVRTAHSLWLRDQPQEVIKAGCSHCLGGLLHAVKDHKTFAFRCGHCATSQADYPTATRYRLSELGYTLDWQHDFSGPVDPDMRRRVQEVARHPEPMRREITEPDDLPF